VVFRTPRIQALAGRRKAPQPDTAESLPVLPRVTPARPRDQSFQERIRRTAAQNAAAKAEVETTDCKRRSRRKSTTLPGLITFKTMRLEVPCTIVDMSGSGARLTLPSGTARTYGDLEHLPDRLTLVLRADRMQVDCEIKWRRPGSLGVRFLGPPQPIATAPR
jgi:hypothetical protein